MIEPAVERESDRSNIEQLPGEPDAYYDVMIDYAQRSNSMLLRDWLRVKLDQKDVSDWLDVAEIWHWKARARAYRHDLVERQQFDLWIGALSIAETSLPALAEAVDEAAAQVSRALEEDDELKKFKELNMALGTLERIARIRSSLLNGGAQSGAVVNVTQQTAMIGSRGKEQAKPAKLLPAWRTGSDDV